VHATGFGVVPNRSSGAARSAVVRPAAPAALPLAAASPTAGPGTAPRLGHAGRLRATIAGIRAQCRATRSGMIAITPCTTKKAVPDTGSSVAK
jgi:hypothetical protein